MKVYEKLIVILLLINFICAGCLIYLTINISGRYLVLSDYYFDTKTGKLLTSSRQSPERAYFQSKETVMKNCPE